MILASEVLFLWTETPLHAGSGSTTRAVDLPIQRERQTDHPIVQGSGMKGSLRDHCFAEWNEDELLTNAVFGPKTTGEDFPSPLAVPNTRLVLFPVRSLRGVCAWVTCPLALAILQRDLERAGLLAAMPPLPDEFLGEGKGWVTEQCPLVLPGNSGAGQVVLEEYTLDVTQHSFVQALAEWLVKTAMPTHDAYTFWHSRIAGRSGQSGSHVVILSDDDFKAFVQSATDVAQRICIDDEVGTVQGGALWTEENLPADSLLYCVLHASLPQAKTLPDMLQHQGKPSAQNVLQSVRKALETSPILQIGGDETIGRGLTRVRVLSPQERKDE